MKLLRLIEEEQGKDLQQSDRQGSGWKRIWWDLQGRGDWGQGVWGASIGICKG